MFKSHCICMYIMLPGTYSFSQSKTVWRRGSKCTLANLALFNTREGAYLKHDKARVQVC